MKHEAYEYYQKKLLKASNSEDRFVTQFANLDSIRRIHFTGICGKAMASLAGLCVHAGYTVTGSDQTWDPPMSTVLEHLGIYFKPFSKDNVGGVDLVVMGNAYSPSNIEAVAAREMNIPQISVAEAYAQLFIKDRTSIVVAGTHGKTTTTGLMAQVFLNAGVSSHVLIGGVLRNLDESYYYARHEATHSIVEGDEYDSAYFDKSPKLLNYKPTIGIITSIEFDHADIYSDFQDYLNAFVFFAREIPPHGVLLLSEAIDSNHRKCLSAECEGQIMIYGFSNTADIKASNIRTIKEGTIFDVTILDTVALDIFIPMFGDYNVLNALSVIGSAYNQDIALSKISAGLASFLGMKQRQELLLETNRITIIDDFAHHPTAVSETLIGIRSHYPDRRLVAVFEPRSATSRRKDFEIPYSESFDASDVVCLSTPPFKEVDTKENFFDPVYVADLIEQKGKQVVYSSDPETFFQQVIETIVPGDVVVIMSNGHFDGLRERLVEFFKN